MAMEEREFYYLYILSIKVLVDRKESEIQETLNLSPIREVAKGKIFPLTYSSFGAVLLTYEVS